MHLNDRMFETHLSTPISQTFALIAGDCNTTEPKPRFERSRRQFVGSDAATDETDDSDDTLTAGSRAFTSK
jgi:hypothetical protein